MLPTIRLLEATKEVVRGWWNLRSAETIERILTHESQPSSPTDPDTPKLRLNPWRGEEEATAGTALTIEEICDFFEEVRCWPGATATSGRPSEEDLFLSKHVQRQLSINCGRACAYGTVFEGLLNHCFCNALEAWFALRLNPSGALDCPPLPHVPIEVVNSEGMLPFPTVIPTMKDTSVVVDWSAKAAIASAAMKDLAERMVAAYRRTRLETLVRAAAANPPHLLEEKWVFSCGPQMELPLLSTSEDAAALLCRHLRTCLCLEGALLLQTKLKIGESQLNVEMHLFAAPFLFPIEK